MLYWLTQQFTGRIGGLHVFSYLTFRAILATASALFTVDWEVEGLPLPR